MGQRVNIFFNVSQSTQKTLKPKLWNVLSVSLSYLVMTKAFYFNFVIFI